MLLPLLVTVKATLKALTAVYLVCIRLSLCISLSIHVYSPILFLNAVCSPACVNGVCNAATFTCDCANNFQGPDCSTPSTYLSCVLCRTPRNISKLLIGPFLLKYDNIYLSIYV